MEISMKVFSQPTLNKQAESNRLLLFQNGVTRQFITHTLYIYIYIYIIYMYIVFAKAVIIH